MKEALKLALEALTKTYIEGYNLPGEAIREAITAIKAALAQPDWKAEYLKTVDLHCETLDELREALAQPTQEPVAWVDLLKQAEEVVRSKSLWKKYIDGTPLANDIAVWMASFAQEHATPPAAQERNFCPRCGKRTADLTVIHTCTPPQENT